MKLSMRFLRHGGIYRSDMGKNRLNPGWLRRLPLVGARAPVKGRDGRSAPCSSASSAMSSGRLFLDRGARQQSPSPLHRQLHPKTVPGWGTIKWQRTANSVLTVCLTKRDNRTEGLPFSADHPLPVRVVRSEEKLTQNHYRAGKLQAETTDHEWLWITTLDAQAFPAAVVRRLGHDRWKLENNGWNDLTQNWAFKHGFLHACRHRPQTTAAENSERHPVANRGLAAVTLILLLAFTLSSAFVHCHSKLVRRYGFTAIEVASQLRRSLSKLPPNIRGPD